GHPLFILFILIFTRFPTFQSTVPALTWPQSLKLCSPQIWRQERHWEEGSVTTNPFLSSLVFLPRPVLPDQAGDGVLLGQCYLTKLVEV
ncbi:hypothetical protein DFJ73DRAFT_822159, partial [Zopfochytrium polystomum]